MKEKIIGLLRNINCFPISRYYWNTFVVNHQKPRSRKQVLDITKRIHTNVRHFGGIYIYRNEFNEILYVGKGKKLGFRLRSHYRESYRSVPKHSKAKRWYHFFSTNRGKLKVYWKTVKSERERKIIEQMLEYVLKPKFVENKA